MKKLVVLTAVVGLLCLGPSAQAETPSSPHTNALALAPSELAAGAAADAFVPFTGPEQVLAAGCSASFDCGDGNQASCTGNSSCSAYPLAVPSFVKCDGKKYFCPNMCFVDVRCTATRTILCSSNVGDCAEGQDWLRCDGTTRNCDQGPGGPEIPPE